MSASAISRTTHHCLTLKKVYIQQIRSGQKTVEGRIFARSVPKLRAGDTVRFYYYSNAKDDVTCRITDIRRFTSFSALLEACGYKNCIPSAESHEEAVAAYAAIPGYTEKAKIHGVAAIYLEPLHLRTS